MKPVNPISNYKAKRKPVREHRQPSNQYMRTYEMKGQGNYTMTINNLKTNTTGSINYDFLDALSDEIKSVSYMISAIGDSVSSTGLPSDPEVFNVTMAKLSDRLSDVAEVLDTVKEDLADEDPEGEEDD